MTPTLQQLVLQAQAAFRERYGRSATWAVAAPGRVNLIGEHTDYNAGFVMPMAIDRHVVIAAGPAASTCIFSTAIGESAALAPGEPQTSEGWLKYVHGVIAECSTAGLTVPPFEAVVHSDVPLGGGLSSSAALEVATATLVETIAGRTIDPTVKALLCQRAEHKYAGTPCGIMDQFTSVFGEADALLLLDCRSQAMRHVPWVSGDVAVLVCDSGVHHQLAAGEYAVRRRQCEEAAKSLTVAALRDIALDELNARREELDDVHFRRARHVVSENGRTLETAQAVASGKWEQVGQLLYASHRSLRDDFEVSCRELDILVEAAEAIGPEKGLYGSRLTGGGFGGCTVNLIRREAQAEIIVRLKTKYREATRLDAQCFVTRAVAGAGALSI
ncbi:MAG: galactokinase [Gemmataceae bacterium]